MRSGRYGNSHRAEGSGRLVEDDHLASERSCPRHGDSLSLAARKCLDGLAGALRGPYAEDLQVLDSLGTNALCVQHAEDISENPCFPDLTTEIEIAGDVESRRQCERLEHGLDS